MITINLGLDNADLYKDCIIQEVAGRKNLTTPVAEAATKVGRNAYQMLQTIPAAERSEITLTGAMAVWAYLIVFHTVVHAFGKVWYSDGRNTVQIAAHGS